jgi:hypothetical protein
MAEDKERRVSNRREKGERRKVCAISFLPVVSFQMDVREKKDERGCRNIQSFAFSNVAVDTEGGWSDGQLRGVRDTGKG